MTLRNPNANESVEDYDKLQTVEINANTTKIDDNTTKIGSDTLVGSILYRLGIIKDYVIETGSNANGNYEKWASGKLVQWGQFTITEDISNAWGSLFVGVTVRSVTFPMPFVGDLPIVFKDIEQTGSNSVIKTSYNPPALSLTNWVGGLNACRPTSGTSVQTLNKWQAIGRWK